LNDFQYHERLAYHNKVFVIYHYFFKNIVSFVSFIFLLPTGTSQFKGVPA